MPNRVIVDADESVLPPPFLCENAEAFLQKAMQVLNYDAEEVSVTFCGDALIQQLNAQYRNIDAPTDVLSFENGSYYDGEDGSSWLLLGDIIISLDTLKKNAEYFGVSENSELKRLLVHGLLHLHGLDHGEEHVEKDKQPECEMLRLQEKILSDLEPEIILR